jgi:hypothetical protein
MTDTTEYRGFQCKMGIGTTSTVDLPLIFETEDVKRTQKYENDAGITGTVQEYNEHARVVMEEFAGPITLPCTPDNLRYLLPPVLGAAASGTSFPLAETIPDRYLTIDRGAKVYTYFGKFGKMVIKGQAGQIVKMTVDFMGYSYSVGDAGTFPSLSLPTNPPYAMQDLTLTLESIARKASDFELTIDRAPEAVQRNALGPDVIQATRLAVLLSCTNPWHLDNYDLMTTTGAAGSVALTNGTVSCTFSIAKLLADQADPTAAAGKTGLLPAKLNLQGKRTSSTAILVVTNDYTP